MTYYYPDVSVQCTHDVNIRQIHDNISDLVDGEKTHLVLEREFVCTFRRDYSGDFVEIQRDQIVFEIGKTRWTND